MLSHRIVPALLVTVLLVYLSHQTWVELRRVDDANAALIAEAESYASRSRLIRKLDSLLISLSDLAAYWAHYAARPQQSWAAPPLQEDSLAGVETLIWVDAGGTIRFVYSGDRPQLDASPDEAQRLALQPLVEQASSVSSKTMLGPYQGLSSTYFNVVVPLSQSGGALVAVIDTQRTFAEMLRDDSPGYSIAVSWREQALYQQGTPAAGVPHDWVWEGMIRTSTGNVLKVVHTPDATLFKSLSSSTVDAVLPLGMAIAALLGLLIFENGRVHRRAESVRTAKRKLAALNRSLESQVEDRTAELAKRNADLVTITESIVHDLRTPLNAISVNLLLIDQLLLGDKREDIPAAIGRANSGVRGMAAILERCGGLSIASQATFQREKLDMTELAAEVFSKLQTLEPDEEVTFELADLAEVEADPTLVRILLLNLLGNSLKYTRGRDDRTISMSCDSSDRVPVYCVRDNGRGLDQQQAEQIFQPFVRAAEGGKIEGMGLGLAIAQRVVHRHEGRLWAQGVRDQFAAFYFTLNRDPDVPRQT